MKCWEEKIRDIELIWNSTCRMFNLEPSKIDYFLWNDYLKLVSLKYQYEVDPERKSVLFFNYKEGKLIVIVDHLENVSIKSLRTSLLHECMHYIQKIEGFINNLDMKIWIHPRKDLWMHLFGPNLFTIEFYISHSIFQGILEYDANIRLKKLNRFKSYLEDVKCLHVSSAQKDRVNKYYRYLEHLKENEKEVNLLDKRELIVDNLTWGTQCFIDYFRILKPADNEEIKIAKEILREWNLKFEDSKYLCDLVKDVNPDITELNKVIRVLFDENLTFRRHFAKSKLLAFYTAESDSGSIS